MSLPTLNRVVVLAARPKGKAVPTDFLVQTEPIRPPIEGEALVRNIVMSVDPYMRGRMNEGPSYAPAFIVGAKLDGGAVGEVIASRNATVPVGAVVQHTLGWREYATIRSGTIVDINVAAPSRYLGVLGMPGLTAYVGLVEVAHVRSGDRVYISAGAGAVGSTAVGIARVLGATTIGSTRSEENLEFLKTELHYDAAFLAREGEIASALRDAAPRGIDVYFDNVGGETLDAAFLSLRERGRIVSCGMISGYNAPLPCLENIGQIIGRRLTMRGFIVSDHYDKFADFLALVAPAVRNGTIVCPETFIDGLGQAPAALMSLFEREAKRGKLIVRL